MTDYKAALIEARARLGALLDGIDDDTFNAKPGPSSWSAAECVVHLNKTHAPYLPVLEEKAALSRPRASGPFRYGFVARRFIEGMKPGTRPVPTSGALKPPATNGLASDIDRARAVSRFESDVDRILADMDAADGLDLAKIKMRSPVIPLLRMPLGAFFLLLGNHALRHVDQAERAVEAARAD